MKKLINFIPKEFIIVIILISLLPIVNMTWYGGSLYGKNSESYYNQKWCDSNGGKSEVRVDSKDRGYVRVDCLTDQYAVETDYARKWAEAIGQSLYYADITGKEPAVLVIIKDKEKDRKHVNKIRKLNLVTIFTINYFGE